ncbi:MAG: hypothetical protein V7636_2141, partial [Actinomycetota bacterium]
DDLRDYFDALLVEHHLDEVADRSDRRRSRRNRRQLLAAAVVLAMLAGAGVLAAAISDGPDDRAVAGPAHSDPPVVVPSVTGMTAMDAEHVLRNVGLIARIDPRLDSEEPDATVLAQEPGPATALPPGSVVGLRTAGPAPFVDFQCPRTTTSPDASADALPPAGQTDLDYVRQVVDTSRDAILAQFGGSRAVLVHRDGRVWVPDGASNPRVEQRADYQIAVELPPSACPDSPQAFGGVPIAFIQRIVTTDDPTAGAIPMPVADLAVKLECSTPVPRSDGPPPGPAPTDAYDCHIGDAHLGLFTYERGDASAAFDKLKQMCAPAVGGDTWIVWANTNEAAAQVHARLGGTLSTVHQPC